MREHRARGRNISADEEFEAGTAVTRHQKLQAEAKIKVAEEDEARCHASRRHCRIRRKG